MSKSNNAPDTNPPAKRADQPPAWGWTRLRSWLTGANEQSLRESIEEVIEQHDAVQKADGMAPAARSMMVNLFEFADLRVDDVMVPRADIVAIEEAATVEQAMRLFAEANHSRLPVHRETLDDLAGMVHIKDLLNFIVGAAKPKRRRKQPKIGASDVTEPASSLSLRSADLAKTVKQAGLVRELLFVPPSMAASDLLIKMQATRLHMAIVVDEYGGTDGLLSIEDLVEVIVGDIDDEHDTGEEVLIRDLGKGVYLADARAPLDEVEALLGEPLLPEERRSEADTLGGLIFAMLGRVPARGEIVQGRGIEFEIAESDSRRVKKIRMVLEAKVPPPAGSAA